MFGTLTIQNLPDEACKLNAGTIIRIRTEHGVISNGMAIVDLPSTQDTEPYITWLLVCLAAPSP